MNTIDLMYYEFMIDLVSENRKINEAVMAPKFMKLYVNEGADEISICEAKAIQTVMEFIKKIFDKVIEYCKKMIEFITVKFPYKPKKQLIEACDNKLKNATEEEKNFKLEKVDFTDKTIDNINYIQDMAAKIKNELSKVMEDFKFAVTRENFDINKLNTIKEETKDFTMQLDERSNTENLKKDAKDVTFGSISEILDDYKDSESFVKDFKDSVSNVSKMMNNYKKAVNKVSLLTKRSEKFDQHISNFKDAILSGTTFINRCMKDTLNLILFDYRNQEYILKKFVSGKSEVAES